ncbi:MAG: AAA family ATPase [Proteobacteria bacterium]|nr:AAA family ATPase [Pseudomonadota bacterium]
MITVPGYLLKETLYESGRTLVYRGYCEKRNLPVVLKIPKQDHPSAKTLARLRGEYKILGDLDSKSVVKAYDLIEYRNGLAMILEDFGGESLTGSIRKSSSKPGLIVFLKLAIKTTEALEDVHNQRIVHNDINPSNIIWNRADDRIKLIDFGIATVLTSGDPGGRTSFPREGSPAYMAPEQTGRIEGKVDYRSDLYSLGVMLYELSTGRLPFVSDDAVELAHSHIARTPIPPSELASDIPEPVSEIVMKLMAKNASERYQSVLGLKKDLRICLRDLSLRKRIEPFSIGRYDISSDLQVPRKLYGREKELESLQSACRSRCSGTPGLILVAGYSGIGKTFFVEEACGHMELDHSYHIYGKSGRLKRDIPYEPFNQAFNELIRQILTESETKIEIWKQKIVSALGQNSRIITDIIPDLELIIGKQPDVVPLPPTEARNRFGLVSLNFIKVFTDPDRPLVIFIDDLQWIDLPSLGVIERLISSLDSSSFLLIGAYRDNEVDKDHPLNSTLDELRKTKVLIHTIKLNSLNSRSINELVSDTLKCDPEKSKLLSNLCLEKTGGNPFFLHHFLYSLHREKLLNVNRDLGLWEWDMEKIKNKELTENVGDLISQRIRRLSSKTLDILKLASCLGSRFDFRSLAAAAEKPSDDVAEDLGEALSEGLLIPLGDRSEKEFSNDIGFKFSHDRIHQVAYSLVPEKRKSLEHYRIGRSMLEDTGTEERKDRIFDIVTQMNFAVPVMEDRRDRHQLAELNLMAGKKAFSSAAYEAALNYFTSGIDLLPENRWGQHYESTLSLYTEAAEAACLCGLYERMDSLAGVVEDQANIDLDKVRLRETIIRSLIARHRMKEAVRLSLETLKMLGAGLPENPRKTDLLLSFARVKLLMAGKHTEDLIKLPQMTDDRQLTVMRLLMGISSAAYISNPDLVPLVVFKMVWFSIKYGSSIYSAYAYISYAFIQCGVMGEIDLGYRYGKFALETLETFKAKELEAKVHLMFNVFITHWKNHLKETLAPLSKGYRTGLEYGDLEYGAICLYMYCDHLAYLGRNLESLERETVQHMEAVKDLKQERILFMMQELRQFGLNLMGRSPHKIRMKGENFDEDSALPLFIQADDGTSLGGFYLYKAMLCFLYRDYRQALENLEKGQKRIDALAGFVYIPRYNFFHSLTLLALCPESEKPRKRRYLKTIAANQKKMKKWAAHAPMNHLPKYCLVEAERARVSGKTARAIEYYDKSIAAAEENEYLFEEALANEAAAEFWMERGNEKIAGVYLAGARHAYRTWGALAKVDDLERRHAKLLSPKAIIRSRTDTPDSFDSTALIKASQTISGEIVLENLLKKMMEVVVENAGAEKAFLIVKRKDDLVIEARGYAENADFRRLQSIPVNDHDDGDPHRSLSRSIVNYVARTGKNVVLDDAAREKHFENDPYLKRNKPKSLLCIPLLTRGKLTGILYLENNLMTGAFTKDRIKMLVSLSSQMAISIENARMYREVRELSGRILSAQEAERKRLARELHDGLGQSLLAVKLNLQMMEAKSARKAPKSDLFSETISELSNSIEELRNIAMDLRPTFLEDAGFDAILAWYGKKFQERTGIEIAIEAETVAHIQPRTKDNLYRIFQEALNNAFKHSGADKVNVSLKKHEQTLVLEMTDNGRGFDIGRKMEAPNGIGLSTMKERTELLGGVFGIDTSEDAGTTIKVEVSLT